jgi:glycosyltransferase involved in cell wall biosynthesis
VVYFACRPGGSLVGNAGALGLSPITHFNLGVSSNPIEYFKDVQKLKSLLLLLKIDILHLHTSFDHNLGVLAARLCRRKVRVVRTHHKALSIRSDPYHRFLYNRLTDLNIVASEAARQLALKRGAIDEKILKVIPGGVDTDRFRTGKLIKETRFAHGFKADHQVLALVSHVRAGRGQMTALESFEKICTDFPSARLLFLGESDRHYLQQLREEVQRRKLGKKVYFVLDKCFHWVRLLDMADVVMVLAEGSEGSARAVLEAMTLEKPVIGAGVGAIAEIVKNEISGWIVPPGNPSALAEAMRKMLTNPRKRKKMGQEGRNIVENSYTNEQRAERMEKLYCELLGKAERMSK